MNTTTANQSANQANVRVSKITLLKNPLKATRAFASVKVGPFLINGFTIIENRDGKGHFVAPPARYNAEKKTNYPYVELDPDFRDRLYSAIVKAFLVEDSKSKQAQAPAQDFGPGITDNDIPF